MKKFSKELNGYNKQEVNSFLNEVIIQMENTLKKIESQQSEIASLKNQIVHYQDIERSLNLALTNAQEVGENIRKSAKVQADTIIDDAYRNANRIINDALIRSERIQAKSENAYHNLRMFKNKLRDIVEEIEILEVDE